MGSTCICGHFLPSLTYRNICFTKEIQSLSDLLIKINFPLIKNEEVDVQLPWLICMYTKVVEKGKEMYNTHYQCGFLCNQLLISY
jgi:hypothetical protein